MGRVRFVGLVVLVAVLAGAAILLRESRDAARAAAEDRREALRAASVYAVSLLSVSHRTVDEDMKRVLAGSTGQEHEEYARNQASLRSVILKNKVVQTGVLRAAALESAGPHTAKVLIVADSVIRWDDGRNAEPEERFFRWRMELGKVAGLWLVSKVERV